MAYADLMKEYLRRLKLAYLLTTKGFTIEKINENKYIEPKKGGKRFLVRSGSFLEEYSQILTYIRLYNLLDEKDGLVTRCGKIKVDDGIGKLVFDGIEIRFQTTGNIYHDSAGFLFYFGEKEMSDMGWAGAEMRGYIKRYDVHNDDIIFDCGAYHGHFAIYAAKKAMGGKVYCFEPDAANCQMLERNIRINGLQNVTIVAQALSEKVGTVRFNARGDGGAHIMGSAEKELAGNAIEVQTTTIEEFCRENKIDNIDFIKMDVEGAEIGVIAGSEDFLAKKCKNMAIASYHQVDGRKTAPILEKMLEKAGFKCETGYTVHQTTYVWR